MICGYLLKSIPESRSASRRCAPIARESGYRDVRPKHVRETREQNTPLWVDGFTNVTNARDSVGATTDDQSIGGSSGVLTSPILSRYVGQELTARERNRHRVTAS